MGVRGGGAPASWCSSIEDVRVSTGKVDGVGTRARDVWDVLCSTSANGALGSVDSEACWLGGLDIRGGSALLSSSPASLDSRSPKSVAVAPSVDTSGRNPEDPGGFVPSERGLPLEELLGGGG